jgi:stage V sporulation protein R
VDLSGSRKLVMHHRAVNGRLLEVDAASLVMAQVANLWGYEVVLEEIDAASEKVLKSHLASPTRP